MDADESAALPAELFLALCAAPAGVKARNEALDADLTVLSDIAAAVRDELGDDASGDDARVFVAVHLVARVAVSLIEGARQLLPQNVYSASALVRQLVEVEYLAWACGHDPAEAVDWLTSDRDARLRRWSPQRLRQRAEGRFDDQDYWDHCEAGGHPTPTGILTLHGPSTEHPELVTMPEVTLYEVTLHALAITDYISHAVPSDLSIAAEAQRRAHATTSDWRARDPAASWKSLAHADRLRQAATLLDIALDLTEAASSGE
ncbi:MAG TPA: hypothetical protein VGM70_09455 [Pseudolysinimonas sp.]